MTRFGAALLLALLACSGEKRPKTEEEWLRWEDRQRHEEVHCLRANTYHALRGLIPDSEFQVGNARIGPNEVSGLFVVVFVVTNHHKLALYETKLIKPDQLSRPYQRAFYVLRGYIFSSLGWPRLAKHDFDAAFPKTQDEKRAAYYATILLHLYHGKYKEAGAQVRVSKEIFEGDPVGDVLLGLAHLQALELAAAAECFDRAARGFKMAADPEAELPEVLSRVKKKAADIASKCP